MKLCDLEKYRDVEGYIDIDKVRELNTDNGINEIRGNSNRIKMWLDLDDACILLRSRSEFDDDVEYTDYAELLVEELAKQVGIKSAHYDLIKYKGQKGVLSQRVNDLGDNESLITCDTLLDAYGIEYVPNAPICIDNIFEAFMNINKYDDVAKDDVRRMNRELARIAIFDTFVMATDRHVQNLGIIYDGKNISVAPMYDNECSLMLDEPISEIDRMLVDKRYLKEKVKYTNQLLVIDEQEKDFENLDWEDMIYYLCDNSVEFMDFAVKCSSNLDIKMAISNVEERISAKLPDELKEFVTKAFGERKKIIERDLAIEEQVI